MRAGYGYPIALTALVLLVLAGCSRSRPWYDDYSYKPAPATGYPAEALPSIVPQPRPVSHTGGLYTVRDGETLYSISRQQNLPIRALIDANDLEPPYLLQRGQRIHIPRGRYHTVRKGDTVYSISRTYGVDMATLMRANSIEPPYRIKLGERLQLPARINTQMTADATPVTTQSPPQRYVPVARPQTDGTSSGSAGPKTPVPPPPALAGGFIWPVQGKIISRFGPLSGGLHNDGINIAVPNGTAVRASQNGVVAYAGNELKGYGNLLLIRHDNGWMTAYAHNSKLLVNRGDTIVKGQNIAMSGRSGSVTSPQVHFEVRKGAKAVDPTSVIGG